MSIEIIRKEEQADGQFNNGAILEKRPVLFQPGKSFPYSNLFYWAHAWSEKGSTIGLHPHQGFEILSFVLKGSIEHFDTKNKTWLPLKAGDVQIIRSGTGISHSEKINSNSAIFQIWFDPDMHKSLQRTASYNDYFSDSFPGENKNGMTVRTFRSEQGPIEMAAEGVVIREYRIPEGSHAISIPRDKIISVFLIEGKIQSGDEVINAEDFFKVSDTEKFSFTASEASKFFLIESPVRPSYETYAEMRG